MLKTLSPIALLCPLLFTAQMITLTTKCTGAASLCAVALLNSTATQTLRPETAVPMSLRLSKTAVMSSDSVSSLSSTQFSSLPSSSSSTSEISTPVSLLTSNPQSTPATTSFTTPSPKPSASSSTYTESCICLTTGPFCAPQLTPRGQTFHGPSSKSLSALLVAGAACPTLKDVLMTCNRVGGVPKVEKCKFMGFGWSVHCAESKVGVDSCGGL
ncbi:hypothetical protein BKA65DRAFT_293576 [Rhexocercosporidium sp. MPI-PUGE-AT-0058]|nr:hypothetical protein BKA65DRAFT_293576 [Rhexocercosporidium sp. MPI-PUGE-AT-0058]